ncbi:MAG: hypothetical protein JOY84_22680 [Curvibacter sp.]|nr:hypothetical protein [Curvibacter sp.]
MKKKLLAFSLCLAACGLFGAGAARAQSEASAALSIMPLASVVGSAAVASTAVGASVAVPAALSVGGAVLTVKAVESTAQGTVYLLERASDGVQVSVEVSGRTAKAVSVGVGTAVSCAVIGAGVVLSAAGEVLAFIPNELGRALLHNERVM